MEGDPLNFDLTCAACGYNLRGLAAGGSCPECGQPVATSLYDRSVARPHWLRCVGLGSLLIGAGMLVGGAGLLVSFWPPLARLLWQRGVDQRAALWLLPVGVLISGAGTWWFATPMPHRAGMNARALAALLRVVGVVTCTIQLLLFLITAAALRGAVGLDRPILVIGARALLVAWSAAALLTCVRAARVAREVGDRPGVVQAWALALLAPLTLLFLATNANFAATGQWSGAMWIVWAFTAASIAGWSAVFFAGFAVVLHRRARGSSVASPPAAAPPTVAV